MVTTRGPLPPDGHPAPGDNQADHANEERNSGFDRQLARLFGESLFGPWLDPGQYLDATRTTRRHGTPFRRLALLFFILCVGTAAGWIVRAGLVRRTGEARAHVAHSLATFLREGELDRAAQFLALLRGPNATLDPHDPHLDLIVRGEAALYRYQDADPARLGRIRPYLAPAATGSASAQLILASLAVASRAERAARLAELEAIRASCDKDPEFHYLLATALEHLGDVKAAQQAWDRSSELGPLWLAHRYEQAWFEARQNRQEAVNKLVSGLVRVAPDSAWARLASERFGSAPGPDVAAAAPSAHPAPAVALFHQNFASALARALSGDLVAARRSLGQAMTAINDQAPFVLDGFDWLIEFKATRLAHDLTAFEAWPRRSELAAARLRRLAEPENLPAVSPSNPAIKKLMKKPGRGKPKVRRKR
jgi:tetratricopeptide (TPR) repeat protein